MTTTTEMNTALGTTNDQLAKAGAYLDRVSPKTDENGDPRANTIDDLAAHIFAHYKGLIVADLKMQQADPEF